MNKSTFFIIGQHAVIEALRNPKRKVLRVFLTEESKKNIHKKSPNKNLLNDAALLITDPIFRGSVTPSKQTKVKFFFSLIKFLSIGFSKCSISATYPWCSKFSFVLYLSNSFLVLK